jgi:hypothetical protein
MWTLELHSMLKSAYRGLPDSIQPVVKKAYRRIKQDPQNTITNDFINGCFYSDKEFERYKRI